MLLYSRNGCNLILLKLSVFLDKGNDAENLKPSYGVLLARLHFSAEELLLYPRRPRRRQRRRPHAKC